MHSICGVRKGNALEGCVSHKGNELNEYVAVGLVLNNSTSKVCIKPHY